MVAWLVDSERGKVGEGRVKHEETALAEVEVKWRLEWKGLRWRVKAKKEGQRAKGRDRGKGVVETRGGCGFRSVRE